MRNLILILTLTACTHVYTAERVPPTKPVPPEPPKVLVPPHKPPPIVVTPPTPAPTTPCRTPLRQP